MRDVGTLSCDYEPRITQIKLGKKAAGGQVMRYKFFGGAVTDKPALR